MIRSASDAFRHATCPAGAATGIEVRRSHVQGLRRQRPAHTHARCGVGGMMFELSRQLPCGFIVVLAAATGTPADCTPRPPRRRPPARQTTAPAADSAASSRALLTVIRRLPQRKTEATGLMLDKAAPPRCRHRGGHAGRVVQKIRSGAMPPAGRRRPEKPAADGFATWLEGSSSIESGGASESGPPGGASPEPDRVPNAIRDLLALDIDARSLLPADESDHGFDNIADVLSISPDAARAVHVRGAEISRLRDRRSGDRSRHRDVPHLTRPAAERTHERRPAVRHARRHARSALLPTRRRVHREDPAWCTHYGTFSDIVPSTLANRLTSPGRHPDHAVQHRRRVRRRVGGSEVRAKLTRAMGHREYELTADDALRVRFSAKAGMRLARRRLRQEERDDRGFGADGAAATPQRLDLRRSRRWTWNTSSSTGRSTRRARATRPAGGGSSSAARPERRRRRTVREEDSRHARPPRLSPAGHRSGRRAAARFYRDGRRDGNFERGIQFALEGLLVSPHFLFRVERDPANVAAGGAIGSATSNWPPGCRSSSGAVSRTTSCWTSRRAASSRIRRSWTSRSGGCWPIPGRRRW